MNSIHRIVQTDVWTSYNTEERRLAEVRAAVSMRPDGWYISGEYNWREPSVGSNNIFAIVDFEPYQITRVAVRRRITGQLSAVGRVHADVAGSDAPVRTGIGLAGLFWSVEWIHQTGSAGENNGLRGWLNVSARDNLDFYARANLYRYRIQEEHVDRSDAYSTTAGLQWQMGRGFDIRSEVQYLRNAVSNEDIRLFLRLSKQLRLRPGRDGGQR
jgi:hypothetical protein